MRWKSALACLALALIACLAPAQNDAAVQKAAKFLEAGTPYAKYFASLSRGEAQQVFAPVLKRQTPGSSGYFVAAWVLACKGIDLRTNTQRVLKPALIWKENSTREFKVSNGLPPDAVMLEDVPQALFVIVRTQRYQPALRALITMPCDGAVAENQDDCIMDLLEQEPVTVLKLASVEKPIYRKLVDTIDWNVGPPEDRKKFLARLSAVKWPTTQLRKAASALVQALKKPIHRDYGR